MDMKRFFLYAIVIAALVLAGCGGNGGGNMAMDDDDGDNDTPMSCPDGQVGTPPNCAPPGPTPEEIAAVTKAAGTKMDAIMAEAAQGEADASENDFGLGGGGGSVDGTPVPAVTTYSLAIERDASATTVKIEDENAAFDGKDDDDDTMDDDSEPQFEKAMDLGMANGFAGSMHVRVNSDEEGTKVEEVVVVRTDIAAPKATPFADVAGQMLTVRDLDEEVNADGEGTAADDFTAITVAAGDEDVNLPKIKSSAFTSPFQAQLTFPFDVAATEDMDEASEVTGTYNGAMGTYRCDGSAVCTVDLDGDGKITAIGTGWVFTPNEGATSDVPDADHLYYGFWLKRTTEEGATTYNEVETYFGAEGVAVTASGTATGTDDTLAASGIGLVTGTADYTGNATGVYVKNVTDSQGGITSATSGVFSALAKLTAGFGGGDIGANNQALIEGTITGFDLEHGEENDWSVKLKGADFSGGRTNNAAGEPSNWVGIFSGATEGDESAAAGMWNGAFYGPAAVKDGDDAGADPDPTAPPHVLGEFGANFTDGAVAGAFGAKKD